MSHSESLTYQWTLLCFLSLFNEYMLVWSRDTTEIDRHSLRNRHISRTWSDWTPWSVCSRTCGGGVRQRTRTCKIRIVGYRVSSNTCTGDTVEYELCSRHACVSSSEEFLDHQCSQHNGQIIGGKRFNEWIPYHYGRNPCELQCWTKDRSFIYSFGKVTDGTPCPASDPKDPALCVNGRCTPVDCAGLLGADNRRDQCGVCRGDNSTCVKYHNTFWRRPRDTLGSDGRKDRHYDYDEIFRIPAGATHIVVSEDSDTNFLVLVDPKGNYLVNGNWRVQSPGRILVHGSEFLYNRTWDGRETLSSEGPTRLPLTVLVLGTGDIPTVHYEYWVSTINPISKAVPQYSFLPAKISESPTKYLYHSQTHKPLDNTIDDSTQTKPIPVTHFQGYKSYYHRNEILKSVPSWSIKRHKTYKHPLSRSFVNVNDDLNSNKLRNRTDELLRHLENSRNVSIEKKVVTQIAETSYKTTATASFLNRTSKLPQRTSQNFHEIGRPNGTSAFTSYNHVRPNFEIKDRRKSLENNISGKSKNESNGKKDSKKQEFKSKSKPKDVENTRSKRKRKSHNGDCLPCSKVRNRIKNFCTSDYVLRATVLASEKQQQGIRFELEVMRSYKNKVPILSREYIWALDSCQCPKLRNGKEYILMGRSSIVGGKRESKLIVDKNSFVRKYSEKRARAMLRLVRDKNFVCRKFESKI